MKTDKIKLKTIQELKEENKELLEEQKRLLKERQELLKQIEIEKRKRRNKIGKTQ